LAGYGPWISELRSDVNPVPPLSVLIAGASQVDKVASKAAARVVGDIFMVESKVQP
jgi:hypothetical protein